MLITRLGRIYVLTESDQSGFYGPANRLLADRGRYFGAPLRQDSISQTDSLHGPLRHIREGYQSFGWDDPT